MRAFAVAYIRHFTYGGLFLLLALAGLGVPAPQDLTLLLAGYFVDHARMAAWITCVVGVLGSVTGDVLGFWLVRKGTARLRRVSFFDGILTSERFARAQDALARHEAVTIMLARNVAGLRTVIFATAAATGTPFTRFLVWDTLGSIPNVLILVGLGYVFSNRLTMITHEVGRAQRWLAVGSLLIVAAWSLRSWLRRRAAARLAEHELSEG